jgi:electron transfer flavoprotein beta subunit
VKADGSGIDTNQVKMSINPFDEIAIEAAVQLKEQGIAHSIVLVSIGEDACQESLRAGLALGADCAIHIKTNSPLSPFVVASLLKEVVEREKPDCVIAGKQAIDGDHNQVGQMLAGLLNWPQATFASAILVKQNNPRVFEVTREVDGGSTTIEIDLPAVITTDLRLNIPRYATLPELMKAKHKPLTVLMPDEFSVKITPHIERLSVRTPAARKKGVRLKTVAELVDVLKHTEGLL